jgi:parallel beta-helix repeat protein
VWGRWEPEETLWRSENTLPEFPQTEVECIPGTQRCLWPEQVFFDGAPLQQVAEDPGIGEFTVDSDRRVILKDDPRNHYVEVTVRRYWVLGEAENVTIQGLTMRHAANEGRSGAIMNRMNHLDDGYADWTLRDNVLSGAHGAVVSLTGAEGLKILNNDISRGGQLGIKSTGRGEIIRANKIHHNNTEQYNWRWEAGGLKSSHAEDVTVHSNEFYHNEGTAIWFDVDCSNITISDNRIHHNARHGIHYELSEGGEIFDNDLWENGWETPEWAFGSAISSANSRGTEIRDNILAWNADGISVIGLDREGGRWDRVTDVHVRHNIILGEDGLGGAKDDFALRWLQGWSKQMFEPGSDNRGQANLYWYAEPEGEQARYEWAKTMYTSLEAFNNTPGEEGGRYLTGAEKLRIASKANIPANPEQHPDHTASEQDSADVLRVLDRLLGKVIAALKRLASGVPW